MLKDLIKTFLFGKATYYDDPVLGQLYTRVKKQNPSIEVSWEAIGEVPPLLETAFVAIDGNCNGPYKHQMDQVHDLINNWDQHIATIDSLVKKQPEKCAKHTNWKEARPLTALYAEDGIFVLAFEKEDSTGDISIYADFKNGKVQKVTCQ